MEIKMKITNPSLESVVANFITVFSSGFAAAIQTETAELVNYSHEQKAWLDSESITVKVDGRCYLISLMTSKPEKTSSNG